MVEPDKTYVYGIVQRCWLTGRAAFVKIGVAGYIPNRLADLQAANPEPLELVWVQPFVGRQYAFQCEKRLHRELNRFHHRGEWFRAEALGSLPPDYFVTIGNTEEETQ